MRRFFVRAGGLDLTCKYFVGYVIYGDVFWLNFFLYAFILRRSLAEDLRRIFARLRFQFFIKEFMFLASCGNIGGLLSLT